MDKLLSNRFTRSVGADGWGTCLRSVSRITRGPSLLSLPERRVLLGGAYRRHPPPTALLTEKRFRAHLAGDANFSGGFLKIGRRDRHPFTTGAHMDANLSPCPVSGRIKVSDELFTYHLSLDARVGALVARAHVRQGVLVWFCLLVWVGRSGEQNRRNDDQRSCA